jgi:hypothetical protein
MKKIKVEVSKQDIEVGTRGEPDCCPIAWALERKDFKEIYVSDAYVNFEDEKGNLHEYYLPPKALGFVKAFDKGEDVLATIHDLLSPKLYEGTQIFALREQGIELKAVSEEWNEVIAYLSRL